MKRSPLCLHDRVAIVDVVTDDDGGERIAFGDALLSFDQAATVAVAILRRTDRMTLRTTAPPSFARRGVEPPANLPDWRASIAALPADPSEKALNSALLDYLQWEPYLGALRQADAHEQLLGLLKRRMKVSAPALRAQLGQLRLLVKNS